MSVNVVVNYRDLVRVINFVSSHEVMDNDDETSYRNILKAIHRGYKKDKDRKIYIRFVPATCNTSPLVAIAVSKIALAVPLDAAKRVVDNGEWSRVCLHHVPSMLSILEDRNYPVVCAIMEYKENIEDPGRQIADRESWPW